MIRNMKRRARRILGLALSVGATAVLLWAPAAPASALTSLPGTQGSTVHAHQIEQLVFQCTTVYPLAAERDEVMGKNCRPPFYGLLTESFIIWTGVGGAPYYECHEGFADAPQYVHGASCVERRS